ncbi:hypothetical protein [Mesorhizobium amorphae]|uniref:hypothetical protein n=1 Tax=Mesorhizobium amorphae TaxID=71433 RepID=UPI0011840FF7|nr:hypothetical protein [Mesorhizobium amorphae]
MATLEVRVSNVGIEIAKPGYDIRTASLANMAFSPNLVAMRVALEGTITAVPHSEGAPYTAYYKATKVFPTPFPDPPYALVAGIGSDGTSYQAPFVINTAGGGFLEVTPHFELNTYADRIDLYVMQWSAGGVLLPTTWKYWIFQNTLY